MNVSGRSLAAALSRYLPVALAAALAALSPSARADSSGRTGRSGKTAGQTCVGCHSASGAAPTVSLTGPTSLAPSATATYTLTITGGPGLRAGMDAAVDNAAFLLKVHAGGPATKLSSAEITHSGAGTMTGGTISYQFDMTAPASGSVKIYASGLSAGGATDETGDHEALTTLSVSVAATNAAPTVATAASATPNPATGTTAALSVLGADDGGEPALKYTWSSSSGPAAVTFSANGTNAAKATTATFTQAGVYTLLATIADAAGLTVTSSVSVTVNAALTSVALTPASASTGPGGTAQFAASAKDQFGAVLSPQPSFAWTVSGGGTVSTTGLFTAGTTPGGPFTVTATASAKSGTASVTVGAGAPPTVASPAAASPNPAAGKTTALSVLGASAAGEPSLTYTWSAASPPAPVVFSPNGTNAAKSSTATFTKAGAYSLTATIRDAAAQTVTSTIAVTVSQTTTTVSLSPASAGVALGATQQFTATALDQFGIAVSPAPSCTWNSSGGGTVDATGLFTAGSSPGGPFTVTGTCGGVAGTASVTVSAGSPPTIATPAAASPNPVAGKSTSLSVLGADAAGEPGLVYTWAMTAGPAPVVFGANGTNAAKATNATFSAVGAYTLGVTAKNAAGLTASSSVAVTVSQTLTTVAVAPPSGSVQPSGTLQFSASGADQFGAALAPQPSFVWSVGGGGTMSVSGLFTAGTGVGGPYTVTASSGGKSGTASVTVSAGGPPTVAMPAAAADNPVLGTSTTLSVLGADDGGEPNLKYTWAKTSGPGSVTFGATGTNAAKNATVAFTKAGSYVLTVTIADAGALTVTSAVTVTVAQTPSTIAVVPKTAGTSPLGTLQFTASMADQFGASVASPPVPIWSVSGGGTIDQTGLFTAGTTLGGPYDVTASGAGLTGTAAVNVVAGSPPTIAHIAAAAPGADPTTLMLTVLGADAAGEAGLVYHWAAVQGSAPVVFSDNDTNSAKNTTAIFTATGHYVFQATLTNPSGLSVSSAVAANLDQAVGALTLSPRTADVPVGASQPFSADGNDQFGQPLAALPALTWTVSGSGAGGTIDANGVFTAGTTPGGFYSVNASGGGKTGAATVHVVGGDTTAPRVVVVAKAVVSGVADLEVLASDNIGVAHVSLAIDGVTVGEFDIAPYKIQVDTTKWPDGMHVVTAAARDAAGNSASSAPVNVDFANAKVAPPPAQTKGGCGCGTGNGLFALAGALPLLVQRRWRRRRR